MKIMSLNTWGGRRFKPLMAYIKKQSRSVDVFCFQEIFRCKRNLDGEARATLYDDLVALLPEFTGVYCPAQEDIVWFSDWPKPVVYPRSSGFSYGIASFVKKTHSFHSGDAWLYRYKNALTDDLKIWKGRELTPRLFRTSPEAMQWCVIDRKGGSQLVIANVHGLWYPGTKIDSPNRLRQSRIILKTLERHKGDKVLCGDFNLLPETKSIAMIKRAGYRNLIKEYSIQDTRGPVNKIIHPNSIQRYADYCFVSMGASVKRFSVPQNLAVSDHLPMLLEIS